MIALPVKQRFLRSKNFTRIIAEPVKLAMMHGLGQYSVLKLATDSIGSFTLTLTNVVLSSGVQIEVASTGASVSNSTALASTVVLGRSSNGRTDWKDAQGRALKVLQGDGSV